MQFPLQELDLSQYVLTQQGVPPTYDLFAISNHFGGLGGGHYTAYAQVRGAGCVLRQQCAALAVSCVRLCAAF